MKKIIGVFAIASVLISCDDMKVIFPKSTFDSPFPKRNRDLTNVLGDQLTIKTGTDTLILKISASKNLNAIINGKTGDTVFSGTVCKFRGLYYFNQQINDSSYWIYAVKITHDLVYGLNTAWMQTMLVDRAIESGNNKKLVKYITVDKIRLHPEKKELKKLFTTILDSIPPDTILWSQKASPVLKDTTRNIIPIEAEDFEYLSRVYPNPASDFITIELQQNDIVTYQLTNLQGKTVLHGQFTEYINKIDLSKQSDGIYALTLINPIDQQNETIKIIKKR